MFRRSKVCVGVLAALGGGLIGSELAMAQERIEITGSNIRRTDAETASPVQVITKAEIEQTGKGTVAEYLQTLTSDGQGSVPFTYGRGFSGATSAGISLRGLGANATLVLINGRRSAPAVLADDAQRSYTDLNQIPLEAVERVEVLKDGASSIYGSDAVAGVVNIILKKNFRGTTAKLTYGISAERDGNEPRVALTHGFGDLGSDGYNVLLNAEFGKKEAIYYRDRVGRGSVGVSAAGQAPWGFDPNAPSNNIATLGGVGWIPVDGQGVRLNNAAGASIIGNVRNPTTLDYYSRGDAAGVGFSNGYTGAAAAQAYCNSRANVPQNNPAGGCLIDLRQAVNQIQPEHQTGSLFARLTKTLTKDLEGFLELSYYRSKSVVDGLPPSVSGGVNQPDGTVLSQANTLLGADHPDNPYQGEAARLRYTALDVGVPSVKADSHTTRVVGGVRGTFGNWDFDSAFNFSEVKQTDTSRKVLNWRAKQALLNPTQANIDAATAFDPGFAAVAGQYWRIGENANLNSAAIYDALLDDKQRKGWSKQYGIDFKASTSLGSLEGGPIGLAVGGEWRHEANNLSLYDGIGNYAGLSLTAYGGDRNVAAAFGEVLFPVLKNLEINAALRFDRYSDAGNSTTPKVGLKWTPIANTLAVRATYSKGFRAPSSTENSLNSIAAFGGPSVDDNVRCAALLAGGFTQDEADAQCKGLPVTFVQRGNPELKPEKSTSTGFGLVWDVTPTTSITADLWQIKRTGLPVTEDAQSAIDAGRYVRDPSTALVNGDPGAILNAFVVFQNSDESLTRGVDVDFKSRIDLGGGMGRLNLNAQWSHLLVQRVITASGVRHDYAGTHGNCDITNCIGSPKDRISLGASWDISDYTLGTNINYRGSMSNKFEQSDTECAQTLADGSDFPPGCKLGSFTTLDISAKWRITKNFEVFGSVANLFDKKPPADFETYGAIGYNPLDYSGAIGRFFRLGLKASF